MAPTDPIIGPPLAVAELPDAEALVREAGWNQVAADWEIFQALGTIYAARAGGRVVATAAILPYGAFAWISMCPAFIFADRVVIRAATSPGCPGTIRLK